MTWARVMRVVSYNFHKMHLGKIINVSECKLSAPRTDVQSEKGKNTAMLSLYLLISKAHLTSS